MSKFSVNLGTMTLLLPSIALLIVAVIGAPTTIALAAEDPFKNKVSIEIDEDNKNTCDESDNGNNNAGCIIALTKNIGPISVQEDSP